MKRVARLLLWFVLALLLAAGYWIIRVLVFEQFDRGYGQAGWLALNLFLSALFTFAGFVAFAVIMVARRAQPGWGMTVLTAAGFAIALQLTMAMIKAVLQYNDDIAIYTVAALVLGALFAWIAGAQKTAA